MAARSLRDLVANRDGASLVEFLGVATVFTFVAFAGMRAMGVDLSASRAAIAQRIDNLKTGTAGEGAAGGHLSGGARGTTADIATPGTAMLHTGAGGPSASATRDAPYMKGTAPPRKGLTYGTLPYGEPLPPQRPNVSDAQLATIEKNFEALTGSQTYAILQYMDSHYITDVVHSQEVRGLDSTPHHPPLAPAIEKAYDLVPPEPGIALRVIRNISLHDLNFFLTTTKSFGLGPDGKGMTTSASKSSEVTDSWSSDDEPQGHDEVNVLFRIHGNSQLPVYALKAINWETLFSVNARFRTVGSVRTPNPDGERWVTIEVQETTGSFYAVAHDLSRLTPGQQAKVQHYASLATIGMTPKDIAHASEEELALFAQNAHLLSEKDDWTQLRNLKDFASLTSLGLTQQELLTYQAHELAKVAKFQHLAPFFEEHGDVFEALNAAELETLTSVDTGYKLLISKGYAPKDITHFDYYDLPQLASHAPLGGSHAELLRVEETLREEREIDAYANNQYRYEMTYW